jgi:hypothetical protein
VFDRNFLAQEHYAITSPQALGPGRHNVKYTFDYDGGGIGKGGTSKLFVNGKEVASARVDRTECCAYGIEGMEVGMDMPSPVSDAYPEGSGSRFTGPILKMKIEEK